MTVLSFSLSPIATGRIYDALICLAKFGEAVSIEAKGEKLTLTALNLSKTSYAAFSLDAKTFFLDYDFDSTSSVKGGDRFTCQLMNKALQSVFKGRAHESRGRETAIERCDVTLQDEPDKTECRLIIKMLCKHGMTKTYRLTYESVEVMHALFDRAAAPQGWRISSRVMREYVEFFGPKTEQLDIMAQEGKAIFTSFTEKISDGKEVLKQPLETAISLHTGDFEDFHMQQDVHIVISVKDFKAIVTHAETLQGPISAYFSAPARPLQFVYENFGIHCEFTLMTIGDGRASSALPQAEFISTRTQSSRQPSAAPVQPSARTTSTMAPPPRPARSKAMPILSQRPPLKPHEIHRSTTNETDPDPESLFLPGGDDEQDWDPPNYDQEPEEEMLGWDAANERPSDSLRQTFRDSGSAARSQTRSYEHPASYKTQEGLEPTQRMSQLHGIFD